MPNTEGNGNGRDLAFRDRVVEFIGKTASALKDIEGDIAEIKTTVRENDRDVYAMCDGKCLEHGKRIGEVDSRVTLKVTDVDSRMMGKASEMDARLKLIEKETLVWKTKIGVWAVVASTVVTIIIWVASALWAYFTR